MSEPIFWMTMTYECESCKVKHTVFLEDGCEGPHDTKRARVPVPFTVTCDCGGFFRHVEWTKDILLYPELVGIPEAPHFRYPSKSEKKRYKEHACGRPVGFSRWNMP